MSSPAFEIVRLKNGQPSIRSLHHGETMHIGSDPREEALSLHIHQPGLIERLHACAAPPFVIWDIGLGPAGNALALLDTLQREARPRLPLELHSFEIDTAILAFALNHADQLPTLHGWEPVLRELLATGRAEPLPGVRWRLHLGDFSRDIPAGVPPPRAVFFDPYSPAKNPGMWSLETLRALRDRAAADCVLTNYTRSTAIRVTLALAGWNVGRGIPTGEKTETTIAATVPERLAAPLGPDWLARVRASTNAAPFRSGVYQPGPISADDFAVLEALPQFKGA